MDKIIISHLGLSMKDLVLIRNLSHLNETWFGNFQLAEEPGTVEGQILIVDIDQPENLEAWQRLKSVTHFENTIVISRSKDPVAPDTIHLKRPIIFRRLSEALQQATKFEQTQEETTSFDKKVLVVDDNLPVRTFMKQKLHELLYANIGVDVAESAEEALSLVDKNKYDLVFMDVVMPGMDGYQACRKIKSMSESKVVMLTSKSSTINRVKAKISGCDGYITKPPEDQELARAVGRFLGIEKESADSYSHIPAFGG